MNHFLALGLISTVLLSSAAWVAAADAESITVKATIAGDEIALTWNAVAGESYALKGTTDLGLPWADVATVPSPLVAEGNVLGYAVPMDSGPRFFRVVKLDPVTPAGMALIPAGSFEMGDTFSEGWSEERPVHTVSVSGFYMDRTEVTLGLWDEVRLWANTNGYDLGSIGSGKASNHPVHSVSWYDVVKWCNARSEKEGRTPAYYTDAGRTTVYRTGQVTIENDWVRWDEGYRLPTEAEWEKAARGGASGHRFPWGDTDTISHNRANYVGGGAGYDLSNGAGYHPTYATGEFDFPYTSPVGSFAANGLGLYDMAGNVWEWCWDWHDPFYYRTSPTSDPRGPESPSFRVKRGGSWLAFAGDCRVSFRDDEPPTFMFINLGFRSVRPSGQP